MPSRTSTIRLVFMVLAAATLCACSTPPATPQPSPQSAGESRSAVPQAATPPASIERPEAQSEVHAGRDLTPALRSASVATEFPGGFKVPAKTIFAGNGGNPLVTLVEEKGATTVTYASGGSVLWTRNFPQVTGGPWVVAKDAQLIALTFPKSLYVVDQKGNTLWQGQPPTQHYVVKLQFVDKGRRLMAEFASPNNPQTHVALLVDLAARPPKEVELPKGMIYQGSWSHDIITIDRWGAVDIFRPGQPTVTLEPRGNWLKALVVPDDGKTLVISRTETDTQGEVTVLERRDTAGNTLWTHKFPRQVYIRPASSGGGFWAQTERVRDSKHTFWLIGADGKVVLEFTVDQAVQPVLQYVAGDGQAAFLDVRLPNLTTCIVTSAGKVAGCHAPFSVLDDGLTAKRGDAEETHLISVTELLK